jgi:hypothetical protein
MAKRKRDESRSHFLKKADDLVKNNHQDAIKGFLIAVGDCYLSQIANAKDLDFVPQKLNKLTGVAAIACTIIVTMLFKM